MPVLSPELMLVLSFALLAGVVRGFSGFGASLIFVPLSSGIITPAEAVVLIALVDAAALVVLVPSAAREAEHRRVLLLVVGASLTVPLGAWLLSTLDVTFLRWVLCTLVMVSVVVLASGWRYRREPSAYVAAGIGGLSGFMGGLAGLFGPPIAVFMLGADTAAGTMRANLIMFFFWMLLTAGAAFFYFGLLRADLFWQALILAPGFGLGVLIGARLFGKATQDQYTWFAYILIAIAAVLGVPVLDGYIR